MDVETLAVSAVDEVIAQTNLLKSSIPKNDKEPSWDGFIYAYKDKRHKKNCMYGRAPVQVKGTRTNPQKNGKITFRVSYADIENYRKDGGALYFVVYIDNKGQKIIYYANLLPRVLNDLLEMHKGKKTFALHLEAFPIESKDVENLVVNFVVDRQKQQSANYKNWTPEEIAKRFNLTKLTVKNSFIDVYGYENKMDYLFNHFTEAYIPVDLAQQDYPVGATRLEMIREEIGTPVSAGGRQFYDSYTRVRDKNGLSICVGNGVLTIRTVSAGDETEFLFEISGTLTEQIEKGEFLLAVLESGAIDFAETSVSISVDNKDSKRFEERYEWNKNLQAALEMVGVKDELDFAKWSKEDAFYADLLIKALLYKEPVDLPDSFDVITMLKIGNLYMLILCVKLESGQFAISNIFNEDKVFMVLERSNACTSPYVFLKREDILKLSNIDYKAVYKSIKRFHADEHCGAVNRLVLEMLHAYDEKQDKALLNATIRIAKWLSHEKPDDPYYLINWYQSVYRKNKKDKRIDRIKMQNLVDSSENDIQIGAAIVIGKHELARELIAQMPQKKQKEFLDFPIMNLLSRQVG